MAWVEAAGQENDRQNENDILYMLDGGIDDMEEAFQKISELRRFRRNARV